MTVVSYDAPVNGRAVAWLVTLEGFVAVATAPRSRRSLLGMAVAAVAARAKRRGRGGRLAALAATARQHVVTFAALASVDVGAFHGGQVAGWIVTGVSLLALDFAVTG